MLMLDETYQVKSEDLARICCFEEDVREEENLIIIRSLLSNPDIDAENVFNYERLVKKVINDTYPDIYWICEHNYFTYRYVKRAIDGNSNLKFHSTHELKKVHIDYTPAAVIITTYINVINFICREAIISDETVQFARAVTGLNDQDNNVLFIKCSAILKNQLKEIDALCSAQNYKLSRILTAQKHRLNMPVEVKLPKKPKAISPQTNETEALKAAEAKTYPTDILKELFNLSDSTFSRYRFNAPKEEDVTELIEHITDQVVTKENKELLIRKAQSSLRRQFPEFAKFAYKNRLMGYQEPVFNDTYAVKSISQVAEEKASRIDTLLNDMLLAKDRSSYRLHEIDDILLENQIVNFSYETVYSVITGEIINAKRLKDFICFLCDDALYYHNFQSATELMLVCQKHITDTHPIFEAVKSAVYPGTFAEDSALIGINKINNKYPVFKFEPIWQKNQEKTYK